LDNYIKRRIKEIPTEIEQTFPNIKKIWKCNDELDFLYGYYVGKIEEGSIALSAQSNTRISRWICRYI